MKYLNKSQLFFGVLVFTSILVIHTPTSLAAGSCDNYTPDANGTTVTCNSVGSTSAGVISSQGSTTAGNNVTVNINSGTVITINGSTVGVGSGANITNNGALNTSSFFYGYGISSGVNGRSQAGGSTITNNGSIVTNGINASGITISATNAGSAANTITNAGTISTGGRGANGIDVENGGAITAINNSGTIAATGALSNGIQIKGAANITNSGVICPSAISGGACVSGGAGTGSGIQIDNNPNPNRSTITNAVSGIIGAPNTANFAIYSAQQPGVDVYNYGKILAASASATAINFAGSMSGGSNNTVTLYGGSTLLGGIGFNKGNTQETLTFNGLSNANFNNSVSGLNIINSINGSNVVMNSSSAYELVSGGVAVDDTSSLNISGVIQDQASPSAATSSIAKTGAGTLTLSGTNTYTGGTSLNAGTIAVGNNAALGTGGLAMATGTILQAASSVSLVNAVSTAGTATVDTNGNSLGLSGIISGSGALTKVGAGTLALSGANTYTGDTNINAGSIILTGSITSNTHVAAGGMLQGDGTINGAVANAGNIRPSFNGSATTLTINGNYVGNSGTFTSNVWGPNTSPIADQLIISGAGNAASGTTGIVAVDRGGLGKPISGNEIPLVTVASGATTGAGAFALSGRVASGAYEYNLYRGGLIPGTNQNNWYLRTDNPDPPVVAITPDARERIEVAVYPALPSLIQMYAQTAVDTLDQRRGDLNLVDPNSFNLKKSNDWARIIGKTGTSTPSNINDGPKLNFNAYALQFGVDLFKNEELAGSRTYVGPYVTIGGANGNTSNQAGTTSTGNINGMQAYSLGLYGTHFAENGLYIDVLAQGSRYLNANASSVQGAGLKTQGSGFTGSFETGGRWNMTEKFLISPQAQIVYDAIGMNNASDAYGQINFNKSEISRGRLGILAGHKDTLASMPIFAHLRANYWSVFNAGTSTTFQSLYGVNPITFQSQTGSRWIALDAEVNAWLTKSTNLFLNLGWENSLVGTYQAISGRVGLQTRF
ncbi:autotransporter outer membrane beta-barrel domain-containing protein [Polynucleobacter sp.]|jgi:outer membrane autotransporter protein|uniref:autotransporter outer membrane beta-barrel domain-containing protein n=1 Tax=Polynucleobacter sp. TaxID=2029855 RepID=UPI0037CB85CB